MTEKEKILLEIAKKALCLNKNIGARLTGSLMLAVMGFNKRREASDIDIVCDYLCENEDGLPIVPVGFKLVEMDGSKSDVNAIQFENEEGVKIDFLCSEDVPEMPKEVGGIMCGELGCLIEAKRRYAANDKGIVSLAKHELDLVYLFNNNQINL